jgi:hypothetical protein
MFSWYSLLAGLEHPQVNYKVRIRCVLCSATSRFVGPEDTDTSQELSHGSGTFCCTEASGENEGHDRHDYNDDAFAAA